MTTRTHLGSTDPQWPGPEAVRKTFPPRWLTVIVVLALGAGTLAGGLLTGEQLLVGVGIGLVATGALILLGFKVKSVNVAGLISLDIDVEDVDGPGAGWVKRNYGNTITVLQTADNRVFVQAPRILQQLAVGGSLDRADVGDVAVGVHEAVEGAPGKLGVGITSGTVAPPSPEPSVARTPLPWVHRPGDKVPCSGIYDVVDDHGRYRNHQRAVTQVSTESRVFPDLDDPGAEGYVLRIAPINEGAWQPTYRPGQRVPWDGVYDVLDGAGHWVGTQKVCVAGTRFPPFALNAAPAPQWYALHHRAVDPPHCPEPVLADGNGSFAADPAADREVHTGV